MSNFAIPTDGLKEKFDEAYSELKKNIKSPNILLLGQTGVGKSSLINTIFGKEMAKVSNVKPETRGFHIYSNASVPVNIIDSEGYELASAEQFKDSLSQYIDENFADITKQIHIAWYCISISSARVLPYDLENLDYLVNAKKIPTCVVFTQCDNDTPEGDTAKALQSVVTQRFGRHMPCFQTSNDEIINKELDLGKLIEWSVNNLSDENLRSGFLIAQKVDLEKKSEKARSRIKYYVGLAGAIGASPIPMSDAVLLTGLQVKMTSDIFTLYGLNTQFTDTIRNIIGGRVISMLGKMVAGSLLKFIPGLGTIAGAAINAGVAVSITASLGYALCLLTKKAIEEEWSGNVAVLEKLFTEENIQRLMDEYKKKNLKWEK